ncbi:MAG TPA: lytic transglycosylase domain-containing protein [Solirubrobacteraceae bacterium]|nr:lytic transglycosylase domain-containing protein [Solirubrobacteraceae bacterium]
MARRSKAQMAVRRRRRVAALVVFVAVVVAGFAVVMPVADRAVKEVTLPLRHEDIIRQQARDKDLDPSLIAAVIYAESHFRDQTSSAGARGLMQITPQTADEIAQRSGGTEFEQGDLGTPQINISYGSWYLRWLLDRYGDNETLAVAAYNAGTGNVDRWIVDDPGLEASEIPFPETRAYVAKVLDARSEYRREYSSELGL